MIEVIHNLYVGKINVEVNKMTVKELIEILQKLDQEKTVTLISDYGITEVRTVEHALYGDEEVVQIDG